MSLKNPGSLLTRYRRFAMASSVVEKEQNRGELMFISYIKKNKSKKTPLLASVPW